MKETLAISVAALVICDVLAEPAYRRRTRHPLACLSGGFVLAALIVPLVFGHWNRALPWVLVHLFALADGISALSKKPFPRLAIRMALLAIGAIVLSFLDPDAARHGMWYSWLGGGNRPLLWKGAVVVSGILVCVFSGGSLVSAVIRQLLTDDELQRMQGLPRVARSLAGWSGRS